MKEIENKVQYPNLDLIPQKRAGDIFGMFQTVSVAPTAVPLNFVNQVQYYKSGATLRLYVYDAVNNVWSYTTLT